MSTLSLLILCVIVITTKADQLLSSDELAEWKNNDYKIGIIGGGASALLTAFRLYTEHDINNIEIFESEPEPSYSALSIVDFISSGPGDIGTVFVPRSSFDIINTDPNNYTINFETNPFFQSLLDRYSLTKYDLNLDFLNISTLTTADSLYWLNIFMAENGYTQAQLVTEIVTLLLYYEQVLLADSLIFNIDDYYNLGLSVKGETLTEFGDRLNLPITAFIQNWFCDIVGGIGPCIEYSSGYSLNYHIRFRISFWSGLLFLSGFRQGDFAQFPFVDALLGDPYITRPSYFGITEGYQQLWDSMSDELQNQCGIDVNYNAKVTGIEQKNNGKISIYYEGNCSSKKRRKSSGKKNRKCTKGKKFDKVFVTVRPLDFLQILEGNDDFEDEYNVYSATSYSVIVFALYNIYETPDWLIAATEPGPVDIAFVLYPTILSAGKAEGDGFDGSYNCSAFGAGFADNGTKIILSGYVDSDAEFDNFEQELEYCLQQFEDQLVNDLGVGTFDIITKRIWQHAKPTAEAEGNGWYEDLAAVQGNPLYFTGEAVTGYTVPSVFSWINKNIG